MMVLFSYCMCSNSCQSCVRVLFKGTPTCRSHSGTALWDLHSLLEESGCVFIQTQYYCSYCKLVYPWGYYESTLQPLCAVTPVKVASEYSLKVLQLAEATVVLLNYETYIAGWKNLDVLSFKRSDPVATASWCTLEGTMRILCSYCMCSSSCHSSIRVSSELLQFAVATVIQVQ